jgi:hypothetical protein
VPAFLKRRWILLTWVVMLLAYSLMDVTVSRYASWGLSSESVQQFGVDEGGLVFHY